MNPILLIMGTVLLLLGVAGAEPNTPHPILWVTDDQGEQPYVHVDYSGQTIDQISYATPDFGKTFLVVNITIANNGYYDVYTNPGDYRVEVNNVKYVYDSVSYSLDDIGKTVLDMAHLGDGKQTSGYLVFQIPANSTEFALIFDNYPPMEVRYNNTAVERYVQVDYSGEVIDGENFPYREPGIGKEYLLVGITIANHGYDDVYPSNDYFGVEVNKVKYAFDNVSYNLDNIGKPIIDQVELGDGGQISGYLVFHIPVNSTEFALIFDDSSIYHRRSEVRYNNSAVEI